MENEDRNTLKRYARDIPELRRLFERHMKLENRLEWFRGKNFLTTDEQVEEKRLKFRKARGKQQMYEMINRHAQVAAH